MIELLVAITLLAIASIAIYQLLFSVADGTRTARSVTRVSDEARLGFNRMVRDTREGQEIKAVSSSPEEFTVEVDFNADGVITAYPETNPLGDYEVLTYSYDDGSDQIRLNGELLMSGVQCIVVSGSCRPVFDYSSENLDYDWNADGVATWQELDSAPAHGVIGVGNNNGTLDAAELPFVTSVNFALRIVKGDADTGFYARAQLRNNR
jgi:hypothetical protein